MQEIETRNSDGTFKKGFSGNPDGKGGNPKGWIPYNRLIQWIQEKYTTRQILNFAADELARDDEFSHPMAAAAIMHIARAIDPKLTVTATGSDQLNKEREALVDRMDGKATQTTTLQNPDGTGIAASVINVIGVEAKVDPELA